MRSFGYIQSSLSDLANFVNLLQNQDRFSVISFSDSVYPTYPDTFSLATVVDASTLHAATTAISGLSTKNMTNMKAAINEANSIMGSSPKPHGMVMLSDGLYNVGGDPLPSVGTSVPIFTIALGDHGQVKTLQSISNKSGGIFQLTPDSIGLASIYFDIVGQSKVAQTVYNRQAPIAAAVANAAGGAQAAASSTVPATIRVRSGQDNAVMTVNWDDDSVGYVYGPASAGKIGVQVMDPDFNYVHPETLYEGMGFVTFRIATPMAGDWQLFANYNDAKTLNLTIGGFDPDDQTGVTVELDDALPNQGGPVAFKAKLHTDGAQHAVRHVFAEVQSPAYHIDEAIERHAEELGQIDLGEDGSSDDPNVHARRQFMALAEKVRDERNIAPRRTVRVPVDVAKDGTITGTLPAQLPGVHTLHLEVIGDHPDGGTVMRTRKASYSVQ
jgi:hypothetical protein